MERSKGWTFVESFIEWTIADTNLVAQETLVDCQRTLARWYLNWKDIWENTSMRAAIAEEAEHWSKKLLDLSGLLRG